MKKLLFALAQKMEPGIIQNIILRLSSKTPKMFVTLQLYSAGIASVIAAIIGALETHQIPDFKYEVLVITGLKFLAALTAGIAASMSLHTSDSAIHNQSNAPQFGPQPDAS
jgi:hypothetical protein